MNRAHCDGMAATLTATLAQLTTRHSLQVTPASLVHDRRIGSAADARRDLGASHALEGSLIRTPSGVRVTYALVDAASARQIDALTVNGSDADMFAMQDAVLNWAVGALRVTLARNEPITAPRTTQSADAYAFALQGRGYLLDYQRSGAIDIAIGLFGRALEIDARYAVAHGGLGEAYWLKYEATKDTGLIENARASCRQAMNLDPGLAAAYVCAARIASGTGEHEEAIVLLERALQADGANDDAYGLLARAHEALGRPELALATYQRAVQLRPQYWATHVWLGAFHRSRGNDAEAAREYERAVELTPDNAPVRGILAGMYVYLGRYDDALAECRQIARTGAVLYRLRHDRRCPLPVASIRCRGRGAGTGAVAVGRFPHHRQSCARVLLGRAPRAGCGPVSMAAHMSRGVDSSNDGANLPDESAPPPAPKAWQEEQLTRNSVPPRATSPSARAASDSVGSSRSAAEGLDVLADRLGLFAGVQRRPCARPVPPGGPTASGRWRPGTRPRRTRRRSGSVPCPARPGRCDHGRRCSWRRRSPCPGRCRPATVPRPARWPACPGRSRRRGRRRSAAPGPSAPRC